MSIAIRIALGVVAGAIPLGLTTRWVSAAKDRLAQIEQGETPEETLVRELEEELGVVTQTPCLAPLTFASHSYDDFHLLMPLYICRRYEGIARGLEGQVVKWVRPRDLRDYPMPPADEPLVPFLVDLLG